MARNAWADLEAVLGGGVAAARETAAPLLSVGRYVNDQAYGVADASNARDWARQQTAGMTYEPSPEGKKAQNEILQATLGPAIDAYNSGFGGIKTLVESPQAQAGIEYLKNLPEDVMAGLEMGGGLLDLVGPLLGGAGVVAKLPIDEATRLARARKMGWDPEDPWYWHGTTHELDPGFARPGDVDDELMNQGNFMGKANYATSSVEDVNRNYAGIGPDLTGRIETRKEYLVEGAGYDPDVQMEILEEAWRNDLLPEVGKSDPRDFYNWDELEVQMERLEDSGDFDDLVDAMATREVAGPHQGAVYPLVVKKGSVKSEHQAIIEFDDNWDDYLDTARKENPDVTDEDDIDDLAREAMDMARDEKYQEVADVVRDVLYENEFTGDDQVQFVVGRMIDEMQSYDSLSYDDIYNALNNEDVMGYDFSGHPVNARNLALQIADKLGVKGIEMDASYAFPHMGLEPGTTHVVSQNPEIFRSPYAKFNPEMEGSSDLLATHPAAMLLGGTVAGSMVTGNEQWPNEVQ